MWIAYKYYPSELQELHNSMAHFFEELRTNDSDNIYDLFPARFHPVLDQCTGIVRGACATIHDYVKGLEANRGYLSDCFVDSNCIEEICACTKTPVRIEDLAVPNDIRETIEKLFDDLYDQVLYQRDSFSNEYGTVRTDHYNPFRIHNAHISKCPFCKILPVRTEFSKERDQYDHYLPISKYPFSAVNFYNLIPTCERCNGLRIKGSKDLFVDVPGNSFYPYADSVNNMEIAVEIDPKPILRESIITMTFDSPDPIDKEIETWDHLYCTKQWYTDIAIGSIKDWFDFFHGLKKVNDEDGVLTLEQAIRGWVLGLKAEREKELNFIKIPVISELIDKTKLKDSFAEVEQYNVVFQGDDLK